jgi:hypothetical protein
MRSIFFDSRIICALCNIFGFSDSACMFRVNNRQDRDNRGFVSCDFEFGGLSTCRPPAHSPSFVMARMFVRSAAIPIIGHGCVSRKFEFGRPVDSPAAGHTTSTSLYCTAPPLCFAPGRAPYIVMGRPEDTSTVEPPGRARILQEGAELQIPRISPVVGLRHPSPRHALARSGPRS